MKSNIKDGVILLKEGERAIMDINKVEISIYEDVGENSKSIHITGNKDNAIEVLKHIDEKEEVSIVDEDDLIDYIHGETGLDKDIIFEILELETEYMIKKGIAEEIQVDNLGESENIDYRSLLADKSFLKTVIIDYYNIYCLSKWEIERIEAEQDGDDILIAYSYDDYPIAYGREKVKIPIKRFIEIVNEVKTK